MVMEVLVILAPAQLINELVLDAQTMLVIHHVRHIGHAGRKDLKIRDDEDVPLWVLQKQDGQLQNKFDACMASVLSWEARTDAVREGAKPRQKVGAPRRLY